MESVFGLEWLRRLWSSFISFFEASGGSKTVDQPSSKGAESGDNMTFFDLTN